MSSDAHRHGQRITRRSFLAGTVAVAAAGGAAAVTGYVRSRGDGGKAAGDSALLRATSRGGTLRTFNLDATIEDTLDPHLTQMGPVQNMHAAVFSKLLQYADEEAGTIVPDLCEGMPEQPDQLTYVIRLRSGVKFHSTPVSLLSHPGAAGRTLDATDVKYSIERQMSVSSPQYRRFFRAANWSAIDSIEAKDAQTVVIKMKSPVAPFISLLAGRHSFIIPREIVDVNDEAKRDIDMVGSGPFVLDTWQSGKLMKLARNPTWFAADDHAGSDGATRPFLDAYEAHHSPQEDAFLQLVFDDKHVDSTEFTDVASLNRERQSNLSDIVVEQADATGLLASRLLLDRPPLKDDRVRRALHLAIDRHAMVAALYPPMAEQRSARISGPIAPASSWAIADAELAKRPGYRTGSARAEDVKAAKQLWSAALGDAAPDLRIFFAGAPRIIPDQAIDLLQHQVQDALGVHVTASTDPSGYALIASGLRRNLEGASEGVVPFTFNFEDGGVDLDEALYAQFRSGAPNNTYRVQDATLDAMLDEQRREFDAQARHKQGLAIQAYLMANVNARLEYLAPVRRRVTWGYVRNGYMAPWYGSTYRLADTWLDTTHPLWSERQA